MFLCGLGAKNEEQESKTGWKMAQAKERRGGGEERKETFSFFPLPLPPLLFFGSHGLISRAIKTETPLPRSLFAPKANGNACYAGYIKKDKGLDLGAEPPRIKLCWVPPHPPPPRAVIDLVPKDTERGMTVQKLYY